MESIPQTKYTFYSLPIHCHPKWDLYIVTPNRIYTLSPQMGPIHCHPKWNLYHRLNILFALCPYTVTPKGTYTLSPQIEPIPQTKYTLYSLTYTLPPQIGPIHCHPKRDLYTVTPNGTYTLSPQIEPIHCHPK